MIRKIWNQLAAKCVNREIVSYFIFGVLTTAVDWVGYFALYNMGYSVVFSQTMSWAAAVLFAFITNKLFVFQSTSLKLSRLFSELVSFVACSVYRDFDDCGNGAYGKRPGMVQSVWKDCSFCPVSGIELYTQQAVYFPRQRGGF